MHKIVMWLGVCTAALGLFFFLMIVFVGNNQGSVALLSALSIGGGLVLSGALLYCFGAIVEHLIAIRENTARQLVIFESLGKKRES